MTDVTERFVMGVTRAGARTHKGLTNQSVISVTLGRSAPPASLFRSLPRSAYDAEAVKRYGWRDQNILVVSADDARLTSPERELVRSLGSKLYGQRAKGLDHG